MEKPSLERRTDPPPSPVPCRRASTPGPLCPRRGLIILDREQGIVYQDASAASLLQTIREAHGLKAEDLFLPLANEEGDPACPLQGRRLPLEPPGPGQSRFLEFTTHPLSDPDGVSRCWAVMLKEAVAPVRGGEKAFDSAAGPLPRMVRGMIHQFRGPLTSLSMGLELLGQGLAGDADRNRLIEIMRHDLDRINTWLAGLRKYVTLELRSLPEVELGSIVAMAVEKCRELFPEFQDGIEVESESDRIAVMADPVLLGQALEAVLRNAFEASADGCGIKVAAALMEQGLWCCLLVSDRGPGIPAHFLPHVCDPLVSSKAGHPGMGLALAKRRVELMGGTLMVASDPPGCQVMMKLLARSPRE